MEEIQLITVATGLGLFIANAMNVSEVDATKTIGKAFVSVIIIGIGAFLPDLISKRVNSDAQSMVTEQKVKKEKELNGEEKLKKLNAYRKRNQKNVLLADKAETEHYINYLKKNDLDKAALK